MYSTFELAAGTGSHKELSSILVDQYRHRIAPSYMSPNAGGGGCGVSANEYNSAHGAQINFGDLTHILPIFWEQLAVLKKFFFVKIYLIFIWCRYPWRYSDSCNRSTTGILLKNENTFFANSHGLFLDVFLI